jgi:DNA-binding beta-propeller fold protein YncE
VLSGTQVITTLVVGAQPGAVGVNPVTGYIYVANILSNNVSVLTNTQVVATLPREWFMPIMMRQ